MKQIVLALSEHPANLKKGLIPALKVFVKHNRDAQVVVFGSQRQTNILSGNSDFDLRITDAPLTDASSFVSETPESGMVTLGSRETFTDCCLRLEKTFGIFSSSLGVLVPTRLYNRSVFFVDVGANKTPDAAFLHQSVLLAEEFLSKVLLMKNPNYALMYPFVPQPGTASYQFDEESRQDPNYKGVVPVASVLDGKNDIVIGESLVLCSALEGAKGAINAMDETEQNEIEKSVFFKFGVWCLRDVNKTMNSRFDRKIYGNGFVMLGFPVPLIGLEETATYGGLLRALDTSKRWLYSYDKKQ